MIDTKIPALSIAQVLTAKSLLDLDVFCSECPHTCLYCLVPTVPQTEPDQSAHHLHMPCHTDSQS